MILLFGVFEVGVFFGRRNGVDGRVVDGRRITYSSCGVEDMDIVNDVVCCRDNVVFLFSLLNGLLLSFESPFFPLLVF